MTIYNLLPEVNIGIYGLGDTPLRNKVKHV